ERPPVRPRPAWTGAGVLCSPERHGLLRRRSAESLGLPRPGRAAARLCVARLSTAAALTGSRMLGEPEAPARTASLALRALFKRLPSSDPAALCVCQEDAIPMMTALACLLTLSLAPAQEGKLEIVNPRATYGYLGARRPKDGKGVLPGDVLHFRFDVKN